MGMHTYTSLANLLKWRNKEAPVGVEGCPAPPDGGGKPPSDSWRALQMDFSDLPRGEYWLLRPQGEAKSRCRCYIVSEIRAETALATRPLTMEESLAAREAVVAQREANVEWLGEQQERLGRQLMMAGRAISEAQASVAQVEARLSDERDKHVETRRMLALERERNEMARQVKLGIQRLLDGIAIWKVKRMDDLPAGTLEMYMDYLADKRNADSRSEQAVELLDMIKKMSPEDVDYLSRLVKGETSEDDS